MMVGRVGVEIGALPFAGERPDKAGIRELMQRVVDGGERHGLAGLVRFLVEFFGRQVPIPRPEQEVAQRHTLARRPQARRAQALEHAEGGRVPTGYGFRKRTLFHHSDTI
uniref:Uncharacterized protein n=1 Tax=Aureimonas frigidaquae TaxID=424757 RepID=A0A0P0Z013_9HYPH|nr:hypothetical protein [Aureimonas frigidaquae]